ncbi:tetratricopeptide repeat protein [Streptomyces roseoverticillatus]|uniref:Tetratricopeptide repeat protein n=1 Tax=Streptomyces roseoverticillatus TaxID=66429 RepID=A0ABV3IYK5_9ACTN
MGTTRRLQPSTIGRGAEWQAGQQNPQAESLCQEAKKAAEENSLGIAIPLYQKAIKAGSAGGLSQLAVLLNKTGRASDALTLLDTRMQQGDERAAWIAINLLNGSGKLDEALSWYERIAEMGNPRALTRAACRLAFAGRTNEALTWYERAFTSGHTDASWGAAHFLSRKGRLKEAASWHARRATTGDADGFLEAADLLESIEPESALEQCQHAAAMGHPAALPSAIRLLRKMGRQLEADLLQKLGWEPDGSIAKPWDAPAPAHSGAK